MKFPESYFEDEVRDGFYVSSMVKRAWAVQLEILDDIANVCRKHGIQYFAEWGTLLGTVRHKGFIPWDDDLDIGMKRADYTKFLAVAEQELPEGYCLLNCHNQYGGEVSYSFLTRVVNGRLINFNSKHLEKFHGLPYVAGIDVFPLDYLAPGEEEEKYRTSLVEFVTSVINLYDSESVSVNEKEDLLVQVEEACHVSIERNGWVKQQLFLLMEKLFSMYNEEEAEMISLMPSGLRNSRYSFPKAYYQKFAMLPFENTYIPVPVFYDAILRKKYGEYLNPVHKGGSHDYPFYKGQEELVREKFGKSKLGDHYIIPAGIFQNQDLKQDNR